jgi:hypothetical protein
MRFFRFDKEYWILDCGGRIENNDWTTGRESLSGLTGFISRDHACIPIFRERDSVLTSIVYKRIFATPCNALKMIGRFKAIPK